MGVIKTILVIEDDYRVLAVTEKMLECLGYRPVGVNTIPAARTVLARGKMDLVLSDVILSDEASGPEFAKEIRALSPDMPIVFMSGYPAMASKGLAEFGAGFRLLDKPFRLRQLDEALRDALV